MRLTLSHKDIAPTWRKQGEWFFILVQRQLNCATSILKMVRAKCSVRLWRPMVGHMGRSRA
jgi:hypothetical protein